MNGSSWAQEQSQNQSQLEKIITDVTHKDGAKRQQAIISLGAYAAKEEFKKVSQNIYARLLAALIGALKDSDAEVRRAAVKSLGVIRNTDALNSLRKLLDTERISRVQIVLLDTLGKFADEKSEKKFDTFFKTGTIPLRLSALKALGSLQTSTAQATVINALLDPVEGIRIVSASLCAQNKYIRAVPQLELNCAHQVPEVRISAVDALGILGGKDQLLLLRKMKKTESESTINEHIGLAIQAIQSRTDAE